MTNKHILLCLIVLLLFDPIRIGLLTWIRRFGPQVLALVAGIWLFTSLPAYAKLIAFLFFLYVLRRPIKMGIDGVYGYFASPIFKKRIKKFKTLKRGYYSFLLVSFLYGLSFLLPLFVTDQALYVSYNGSSYFPAVKGFFRYYFSGMTANLFEFKWEYYGTDFGLSDNSPVNFRDLKKQLSTQNRGDFVLLAPYPYAPNESNIREYPDKEPPHKPDSVHVLGTDDRGRDVFARLAYGFNISMSFALIVVFFSYLIGVSIGGYLGYFGGTFDIVVQRFVEIWSAVPFLYTVMIVVSIMEPNIALLIGILVCFGWMGMTFYIRGEFLREKSKDYVSAAISIGLTDNTIIFRHILPNSLTPVISFLPFAIVGNISSLVSLDFLGFGLPAPTPSWGELMSQAMSNLKSWWLVASPLGAMFLTLLLVSFIGEAVREAFDPKQYSRLR